MYKTISILVVLIILIVSAIVCLLSFRLWSPDKPIVSARLGNDAVIIKGFLSDYQRATDKPSQLLLLHANVGRWASNKMQIRTLLTQQVKSEGPVVLQCGPR